MNELILALQLFCTSPYNNVAIYIDAEVKSTTEYSVTLKNTRKEEMEMFRSKIQFDDLGSIIQIDTHHWFENFQVKKTDHGWEGIYQYDLAYYPLSCIEK